MNEWLCVFIAGVRCVWIKAIAPTSLTCFVTRRNHGLQEAGAHAILEYKPNLLSLCALDPAVTRMMHQNALDMPLLDQKNMELAPLQVPPLQHSKPDSDNTPRSKPSQRKSWLTCVNDLCGYSSHCVPDDLSALLHDTKQTFSPSFSQNLTVKFWSNWLVHSWMLMLSLGGLGLDLVCCSDFFKVSCRWWEVIIGLLTVFKLKPKPRFSARTEENRNRNFSWA